MRKNILLFIILFLFGKVQAQEQETNFCSVIKQINSALSVESVNEIIADHFTGILTSRSLGLYENIESPIGSKDAYKLMRQSQLSIKYKLLVLGGNYGVANRSLADAKAAATEIVEFFNTICDITEERDPMIRWLKIADKILEKSSTATGHLKFIIDLTQQYLEVVIKIKQWANAWGRNVSSLYFSYGLDIVVQIGVQKNIFSGWQDLSALLKSSKFERVDEYGTCRADIKIYSIDNYINTAGELSSPAGDDFDRKSIKMLVPGIDVNTCGDRRHFIKWTITGKYSSDNIVILPLNSKIASEIQQSYWKYRFELMSGELKDPGYISLKLK